MDKVQVELYCTIRPYFREPQTIRPYFCEPLMFTFDLPYDSLTAQVWLSVGGCLDIFLNVEKFPGE